MRVRTGDRDIGVLKKGKCFCGMSFLRFAARAQSAVAQEGMEAVAVSNENIKT